MTKCNNINDVCLGGGVMKKMLPPPKYLHLFSGHPLVDRLNWLLAGAEVKPASDVRVGREGNT